MNTKRKQKIVYVIPTYNEIENISEMLVLVNKVLLSLKKYTYNILVVDDNSPDGTAKVVKEFRLKNKSIVLLTGVKNGLGAAMIKGFKYATNNLKADIVIANEADFSFSPKRVPYMISKIEKGYDVVVASRRFKDVYSWPLSRRIIHMIANSFFAGVIAGVSEVEDHNSAFKAIRVKGVLDSIDFSTFPKGFGFFNYLVFKLSQKTSKIVEFGTTFTHRTRGQSKVGNPKYLKSFIRDVIEYVTNCFQIRIERTIK